MRGRARQAIAWTTGFQIFRDALQFGLMLVLVRLLPADVYGQFGFVTTLVGFLTLFSFREFLGHTLVVRDPGQVHYQDHFTAGAAFQVGVCLVANLVAIGLRWVPAYADVAPVLHVMSVLFLLDLPSEFRVKVLERALDWRRLRLLHGLALVASGALSIAMALRGWGVYALLVPTLVVPVVFAWDLWFRARWRPTWQWSWARFKPAWTFGTSRIAASSLTAAAGLIESSWLAALAGFAALGVFGRALALAQLVCGRIAKLLGMSVFPVLARIEARSPSYRRASAAWLRSVAWVVAPLAVLGAQVAEPLVRILYGPTWLGAAPLLPAALAAGAIGALVHTAYLLLLAQNGAKWCLIADSWRLAGTVVCLVVLAPIGLDRYLAGLAIVYAVSLSLLLVWLRRDEALSREGLRDAFVPPALAATAAGALSLLAGRLVGDLAGDWGTVAIHSVVVGATYVLVLRLAFEGALAELVSYMPERRRLGIVLRLNTDH